MFFVSLINKKLPETHFRENLLSNNTNPVFIGSAQFRDFKVITFSRSPHQITRWRQGQHNPPVEITTTLEINIVLELYRLLGQTSLDYIIYEPLSEPESVSTIQDQPTPTDLTSLGSEIACQLLEELMPQRLEDPISESLDSSKALPTNLTFMCGKKVIQTYQPLLEAAKHTILISTDSFGLDLIFYAKFQP